MAQHNAKNVKRHAKASSLPDAINDEFDAFERKIYNLDKKLRKLSNKARELRVGSSVGILSACDRLRKHTKEITALFRENASDLLLSAKQRAGLSRKGDNAQLLVEALQDFASDVITLVECFRQFPAFVHEFPDKSLTEDLKEWATSLDEFRDSEDMKSRAAQSFLYQSMADIGIRLERITKLFLPAFIKVGIPIIQASQKHAAADLGNLSTVAALFAGATATMLQFSYNPDQRTTLYSAVNVCWFTSLIFSISAAVNSVLALAWTQSIFRSPDYSVPWYVRIWVKRSPLVFAVISVACFFIGLILFTYASQQDRVTSTATAVLSSLSYFGLTAMSLWFASELWTYIHYEGQKWLADVLLKKWEDLRENKIVAWFLYWRTEIWDATKKQIVRDPEAQNPIGYHLRPPTESLPRLADDLEMLQKQESRKKVVERWQNAKQLVLEKRRNARKIRRADSSNIFQRHLRMSDILWKLRNTKVAQEFIMDDEDKDAHDALLSYVQFTENGKAVVTSSWDRKFWVMGTNNDSLREKHKLSSIGPDLGFTHQLEWSPKGDMLLFRHNRSVSILDVNNYTEPGNLRHYPSSHPHTMHAIQSVVWISDEAFLCVERDKVIKVNSMTGETEDHFDFDGVELRDVAVERAKREPQFMVCAGRYSQGREDPSRNKSKNRFRLFIYDLHSKTILKEVLMVHEILDVKLTSDDEYALVSYEDKTYPQLWWLHTWNGAANLALSHTYVAQQISYATLPSIFAGPHDMLVMRADAAGNILCWERETAELLHCIQYPGRYDRLTSFAFNPDPASWMLVTGTLSGTILAWTVPTSKPSSPDHLVTAPSTPKDDADKCPDIPLPKDIPVEYAEWAFC